MIESLASFFNTLILLCFGIVGWVTKSIIQRIDLGEKRMTKIEVELAAQKERDIAVENRMGKVESAIQEIHNKLDRMMEVLMKR
jgi:hypothetical protein